MRALVWRLKYGSPDWCEYCGVFLSLCSLCVGETRPAGRSGGERSSPAVKKIACNLFYSSIHRKRLGNTLTKPVRVPPTLAHRPMNTALNPHSPSRWWWTHKKGEQCPCFWLSPTGWALLALAWPPGANQLAPPTGLAPGCCCGDPLDRDLHHGPQETPPDLMSLTNSSSTLKLRPQGQVIGIRSTSGCHWLSSHFLLVEVGGQGHRPLQYGPREAADEVLDAIYTHKTNTKPARVVQKNFILLTEHNCMFLPLFFI